MAKKFFNRHSQNSTPVTGWVSRATKSAKVWKRKCSVCQHLLHQHNKSSTHLVKYQPLQVYHQVERKSILRHSKLRWNSKGCAAIGIFNCDIFWQQGLASFDPKELPEVFFWSLKVSRLTVLSNHYTDYYYCEEDHLIFTKFRTNFWWRRYQFIKVRLLIMRLGQRRDMPSAMRLLTY
jgi:hypothetical protein